MHEEKQSLSYIFKRSLEKAMGKALDYGRISGMSERSFKQYERSLKNDFNSIIEQGQEILVEAGYLKPGDVIIREKKKIQEEN